MSWGGTMLRKVEADLARGWKPGLTVLTGDDTYHLDRAQTALLDALAPDRADGFALSLVGDEPIATGALVGAARSGGMFAARRVVLLKDVAVLEGDPEPLRSYASDPPRDSYLIVRAPKLDRKRKLHKALAEAGICLEFRALSVEQAKPSAEFEAALAAIAAAEGMTLARGSGPMLIDLYHADVARIASELTKIRTWLGETPGRPQVTPEIVAALGSGSALASVWTLGDAILERDAPRALAEARRLLAEREEPLRILGGIATRMRALLQARAMRAGGTGTKAIVDGARAWYFRDALAAGMERYTLEETLAFPSRLLAADRTLKSSGLDGGAVIETLVRELTGVGRARA
ncbi:MAG TPA: DNA polymerase III subunit delta [Candidatus Polarisedimenticolaceae bacterium]|nr:DNA polymerase III subunit delta [Candidatus Polarisedimenticolaceae bacterium]